MRVRTLGKKPLTHSMEAHDFVAETSDLTAPRLEANSVLTWPNKADIQSEKVSEIAWRWRKESPVTV